MKKITIFCIVTASTIYICWFALVNPTDSNYRHCDSYTKFMNGGKQVFQNETYDIVLCGLDGRFDPSESENDVVRLQVLSRKGELLATRYFEPLLGMRGALEIEYHPHYLIYNDGEGSGYQTKMSMPPDRLDWILARLPRLWP